MSPAAITRTVPTPRVLFLRALRGVQAAYTRCLIGAAERDIVHRAADAIQLQRDLDMVPKKQQAARQYIETLRVRLADLDRTTP